MSNSGRPDSPSAIIGQRPHTRRYADRKAAYISAAIPLINRYGVGGMTLNRVAAELGQAPKAVAYYFKNKEALAAACLQQGIARTRDFVVVAQQMPTPRQRVELFLLSYFDYQRRAALGEVEELTAPNDIRALDVDETHAAYGAMFRDLRNLLIDDESKQCRHEINALAHLLLSQCHWSRYWLPNVLTERYSQVCERMTTVILDGIASPGNIWAPKAMPPRFPRLDPAGESAREMFLRAATELINEQGYHGASVDRISARLSLTKGAFYHHIASKDELILACFDRTLDIIRDSISAAEAISTSALQTLATFATALVLPQVSGQGLLLRMSAITTLPETLWPPLLQRYEQIVRALASIVSDGIVDGSIRPVDSNLAAQTILGMINSADELPYFSRKISVDSAISLYIRPCFEGLIRC
jgi:AcrR family transcriptional regulator